jgi:rubrerythrin
MTSILEQAIQLEVKAESHYREAAQMTSDSNACEILEYLADEEAQHAKILRGMLDVEDLRNSHLLEKARVWVRGVVEGGLSAISFDVDLLAVLRRAMDIEQATESFYRDCAIAAEQASTVGLFTTLADIEKGHFLLIGSLVEYFDRPNEWIESAEFGLRDEY